ncbi:unnamed protein product, partial [Symbiodinium sp. CCMP2456]
DLSHQRFRSLELIVDASPKGKLDVWSPIGYAGRVAAALPLQRLSALAVSTVSAQIKMEEGQKIVDKFAETAAEGKQAKLKKMHLGTIKTRMVEDGKAWLWDPATGEACWDCLTPRHQSHLRLILAPDEGSTLWAAFTFLASQNFKVNFVRDELHKLQNHYLRLFQCNKAAKRASAEMLYMTVTGTWALSEWLMKAKRGPWDTCKIGASWKQAADRYLQVAHSGDLLQELFASSILAECLGVELTGRGMAGMQTPKALTLLKTFAKFLRKQAGFKKYYSATLLVVLWGCLEEGINPFADMGVAATGNDGQKYSRIMDSCIRALIDEEAHKLFESLQFFTEPWCEMCLWLEGLGPQGMACLTTEPDLDVDLQVVKRRCRVQQDLLRDHLDICLVTLYELGSYQLYLRAAPASSACLLLTESTKVPDLEAVQATVLQALEFEWATVLSMEQNKVTADLLHKLCPHVLWQVYRETLVGLETDGFKLSQTVRDLVMGWFPRLSFSANIEDQFAAMQDNVRRGSKGGSAGITNLSTVGVKALYAKMLDGDGQATSVRLQDNDWEGTTVRGQDVHLDSILSGASGTSAHQHNKGTLNYMRAFVEARKLLGVDCENTFLTYCNSIIRCIFGGRCNQLPIEKQWLLIDAFSILKRNNEIESGRNYRLIVNLFQQIATERHSCRAPDDEVWSGSG